VAWKALLSAGLFNRSASSPYLLSGFLKCSECGGNLVLVRGRSSKYATYGCAQYFSRGACSNSVRIRLDQLETMIFEKLQTDVLRPEVLDLTLQEFHAELTKASEETRGMAVHYENRMRELEAELRNLTAAVAKAKGSTSVLEAIAEREREVKELKRLRKVEEDRRPERVFEGLDEFVRNRVSRLRELMQVDVSRAKVELGKHLSVITMRPEPDGSGYAIEGEWDLVGDRFPKILATSLGEGCGSLSAESGTRQLENTLRRTGKWENDCGVGMVPGGGIEPPRAQGPADFEAIIGSFGNLLKIVVFN
jgi:hypothetical protein